jgi:hypothetical protein
VSSWIARHTLVGIGDSPPEFHEGNVDIDPAAVYTAATINADMWALTCTTIAFAPIEDDPHVTPVPELAAQLFVSV